jgi:hypothetical protein
MYDDDQVPEEDDVGDEKLPKGMHEVDGDLGDTEEEDTLASADEEEEDEY